MTLKLTSQSAYISAKAALLDFFQHQSDSISSPSGTSEAIGEESVVASKKYEKLVSVKGLIGTCREAFGVDPVSDMDGIRLASGVTVLGCCIRFIRYNFFGLVYLIAFVDSILSKVYNFSTFY